MNPNYDPNNGKDYNQDKDADTELPSTLVLKVGKIV